MPVVVVEGARGKSFQAVRALKTPDPLIKTVNFEVALSDKLATRLLVEHAAWSWANRGSKTHEK